MNEEWVAVLLPGLDGTGRFFGRLVEKRPPYIRPRIVTYPGDRPFAYVELCELVRPQLPASEPFIIVAESFSGPVAVTLASRPPANLRGTVLVTTFVTPPYPRILRRLPWSLLFRILGSGYALRGLLTGSDRILEREMRTAIEHVSPRVLAARIRAVLSVDVRQELAKVTCPLLYLRAQRDRLVPPRCLRDVLAVRDDVGVQALDTLHPVLQHEPEGAWSLIEDFARRIIQRDR